MPCVAQEISSSAAPDFLIATRVRNDVNSSTGPSHFKALTSHSTQFLIGNEKLSPKKLSPCNFSELQISNREEFSFLSSSALLWTEIPGAGTLLPPATCAQPHEEAPQ
jgi:hypothetical protein